ncbi:MAG: hypothetical protein A2638_02870 [Nitrospirae bacterium RIFCSPHIGHO2_01_FULL_66_17]|nr:MAG: hypothetical protein A2638_02870 [Nitrospirae bacterium RIFCSPHIGHO2_01_FULL_66_17]
MIWGFTIIATVALLYVVHVFLNVNRWAAVSGAAVLVPALGMELLNGWIGPFWIAQESVYLVLAGCPVEKLILYAVGGTWACVMLDQARNRGAADGATPWLGVLGVAALLTTIEWFLNLTQAFRWVRPWTVVGAFVYYGVGAVLLFRLYDARSAVSARRRGHDHRRGAPHLVPGDRKFHVG